MLNKNILFSLILLSAVVPVSAQKGQKVDTTRVSAVNGNQRNVMLNASDNTSPREINIGLPSSVGGTTILENDLPVVYYYWPELPNKSWRQSVSLKSTSLMSLSQVAGTTGNIGYAVNSYSQTGTKNFQGKVKFTLNNYGWIQPDINISGPINNGWAYSAGVFLNYDPGTTNLAFTKYADQTKIFRIGLTKFFNNKRGQINFQYKYADSYGITDYSLFEYEKNGKVKEVNGYKIGRSSYIVNDGTARYLGLDGGEYYNVTADGNYAKSKSHTINLFGKYVFDNAWQLNFSSCLHIAKASVAGYIPTGLAVVDKSAGYAYKDGTPYSGYVGTILGQSSPRNPITDFQTRLWFNRKFSRHDLNIGLLEQLHDAYYSSNRVFYYQTAENKPQHLYSSKTDEYGFYNYNKGAAYYDGKENQISVYGNDNWQVNRNFNLNYGLFLRYHTISGKHCLSPRNVGFTLDNSEFENIHDNLFNIAGFVNAKYNITKEFGVVANFQYTETNGGLENYNLPAEPNMKKSRVPLGGIGIFWNNKYLQLISQGTILYKNNYLTKYNMVNPSNSSDIENIQVYYDVQTIGWTSDAIITPFKGFALHLLLTLQNPIYKNFSFTAFKKDYDYSGKNVLKISKILSEIDPSYTFGKYDKWKLWASFRYYSKQFANLTNVLYFAPHWETFAGLDYKLNKHIKLSGSVVNFLNDRGATGTINGAELVTDPTPYYGRLMTGSSIMPFTLRFSAMIKF
ncbi:MAG: hypothetical protein LKF48_00095 [Prevotella sp.]|jgi:hypothetical protein|nr:hypothetical protein [Prevotella sp.]MCH4181554.1 hypothetical protein [Prevotella sp.]MCH4212159.1 hypothetical protein [Prevotella sp.]MCH4241125.1 hypothetical protein [Prevotella sp.]